MSQKHLDDPRAQFPEVVDDEKLRLSLAAWADRIDETARQRIYRAYNDDRLHSIYRGIRASGIHADSFGKERRKIVSFPSPEVYRFVDLSMKVLYGPEWLENNRALRHDLVRPWLVVPVNKL